MIRRQFREQSCHFRSFCSQDYSQLLAEKIASPRGERRMKISLKTGGKQVESRVLSPSPGYQHRHTPSMNCPTVAESTRTVKPVVKFSWRNEMVETARRRNQGVTGLQARGQCLDATKVADFKGKLLIESRYTAQQQQMALGGFPQGIPETKFQESLILVDYFHPSKTQMRGIESYLHGKEEGKEAAQGKEM